MMKSKTAITLSEIFSALAGVYVVSFKFTIGSPEVPTELKNK
ncbi:hypothetical protein [Brevibacillus sp. 7WMA2]|nr:hypothetical protein [Brevibacillus sp. 7WMA2]